MLQRFILFSLSVCGANVVWAALLSSGSGRLAGVLGAVISAAFAGSTAVPRVRQWLLTSPPAFLAERWTTSVVWLPFLLPALVLHASPVLAFWRFDGAAALLTGWLIAIAVALALEHRRGAGTDRRTVLVLLTLLLVFSSGLWLRVIGDLGIGGFMTGVDRGVPHGCQGDPLTRVITLWESNPASEHLFLWWRSPEDFAHRIAYPNHVHPYLFTMYGWIAGVRRLTGLPLWAATNTSILLPMLALIAAFGTLLARSGLLRDRTSPRGVLTLFLATGILLTTWRVWIDLVRFNSDNPYPLLAAVLIVVYALLLPPMRTGAATIAAALFVALSPIHTPMLILAAVCLFGQGGRDGRDIWQRNRSLAVVCIVALLVGVVTYLEPQFLIARKGYATSGSSLLFRSGLDGDTTYFRGILQAVIAPCPVLCCYARPLSELLFPAVLPLAIFGPLAIRNSRSSAVSIGRQLLFLTTPYLISLIFFPQSVSIHPYLYDHLLIIPIVVTGLTAMLSAPVEQRLTGGVLLVFLLFTGGVLMANLIAIAQGLVRG